MTAAEQLLLDLLRAIERSIDIERDTIPAELFDAVSAAQAWRESTP